MLILLTGGSANGKSTFGEALCVKEPMPRYYLAAMRPYGAEGEARIKRHRALRQGKGFETIERYTDLAGLQFPERGTVLLECIANLTANEMFDGEGNACDPYDAVMVGVEHIASQSNTLVVITNDVGAEYCTYGEKTEAYVLGMGRINTALAEKADIVCELVCGIPLVLKGVVPE